MGEVARVNDMEVLSIENSPHSKHRDVTQNAILGASQNQPAGKALPPLVLGTWETPAGSPDGGAIRKSYR